MANVNDVVTLLTPVGEIVGRFKSQTDTRITLDSPRTFVQTEQGMGFAPGICMTGKHNIDSAEINKGMVVSMIPSSDEVEKAWMQATSGLVL